VNDARAFAVRTRMVMLRCRHFRVGRHRKRRVPRAVGTGGTDENPNNAYWHQACAERDGLKYRCWRPGRVCDDIVKIISTRPLRCRTCPDVRLGRRPR
jgi:hypothetical protein